ncbi:AAA family ATPase [Escherichia coli]|nr:AAA family ATPase [Escherichia coli]
MREPVYLEDVFKLSGIPTITFVEPNEYKHLYVSIRTAGRGVIIEGPSGIGKTTCVRQVIEKLKFETSSRIIKEFKVLSGRKKEDKAQIEKIITTSGFGGVIIDDFHKLDDELKHKISDLLKNLADEQPLDSKLIIIGINKTGKSLIDLSPDLLNRISIVKFESNPEYKVRELLEKGENALNFKLNVKEDIVKDSDGAFHLAQMLAYNACLQADITEELESPRETNISYESLKETVIQDLSYRFNDIVVRFVKGQRVKKGSRAPYLHVLYWLSKEDERSLNLTSYLINNPNHRNSVGQILTRGHLKTHYESNPDFSDVVHYNDETTEISIEDPKFYYYIKNLLWSKLAEKIGFTSFEFKSKYDFALSFAGANRNHAEYLNQKLIENELSVFYDFNEQARILSEDVEQYLAPIYRSESVFVIPFLSRDYPTRIWCKFEGDTFRDRFGDGCVIPLRYSDAPIGMFDTANGIGGFTINPSEDIYAQLDTFANLLVEKICEKRMLLNGKENEE